MQRMKQFFVDRFMKLCVFAKKDPIFFLTLSIVVSLLYFLLCSFIFMLWSSRVSKSGYVNNFDEIPGMPDEKVLSRAIQVEDKMFYYKKGAPPVYSLQIIGKFTQESTTTLLDRPSNLGLPKPLFDYQDYVSIDEIEYSLIEVPEDLARILKLYQDGKKFRSTFEGNLVWFSTGHGGKWFIKLYLFDKSGYFIMDIIYSERAKIVEEVK